MLVIRLLRVGKKNQPSFKIVVTEKQNPPRGGRFVEEVGFYNPVTKQLVLKKERAQYWLERGAQPSDTIHNLLIKEGVLQAEKISVHKKPKKKEEKKEKAPVAKPEEAQKPEPAEAEPQKKEEVAKEEKPQEKKDKAEPKPIPKEEKKEEVPKEEPAKEQK